MSSSFIKRNLEKNQWFLDQEHITLRSPLLNQSMKQFKKTKTSFWSDWMVLKELLILRVATKNSLQSMTNKSFQILVLEITQ